MNIWTQTVVLSLLGAAIAFPTGSQIGHSSQSSYQSNSLQSSTKISGQNGIEGLPFNAQQFMSIALDFFSVISRMANIISPNGTRNAASNTHHQPSIIASPAIIPPAVIPPATSHLPSPVLTAFKQKVPSFPVFPAKGSVPDITKMSDSELSDIVNKGEIPGVSSVAELRSLYSILPDSYKKKEPSQPTSLVPVPVQPVAAPVSAYVQAPVAVVESEKYAVPAPEPLDMVFATVPDTPEVAKAKAAFERAYEQQLMAVLG